MTIQELIDQYLEGGVLALVLLSGIIDISPIKINPWKWIFKKLGRAINGEMIEQIDKLNKRLDTHIQESEKENIKNKRKSILRFNDELLQGIDHTKEHFDEVLESIDDYERYCEAHPEFPNNKATLSISNIKTVYKKLQETRKFL